MTLRDGKQPPRTSFSYEEERDIVEILDDMDTHVVEAGFPVNSEAEFEAVVDIAASMDAITCGLARVVDEDIEAALDSSVDMVHTFVSTNDVQLADSIHASRGEVVEWAVHSVKHVHDAGTEVVFSPMDAIQTDKDFLIEVVETVFGAGVDWINLSDICGAATSTRFACMVATVRECIDVRIDVHAYDDSGLASANAMTGLEAGVTQTQVLINGIGERAGNAVYEGVVMAARSLYGVDTGIDTTKITELTRVVGAASDIPIPANKPVVGRNTFSRESDIHAANAIENADTFEPGVMTPETVGATRGFVLNKYTGTHSVRKRLADIGSDPSDAEVREITRRVKDHGTEKERVDDSTPEAFVRDMGITHEGDTEEGIRAWRHRAMALRGNRLIRVRPPDRCTVVTRHKDIITDGTDILHTTASHDKHTVYATPDTGASAVAAAAIRSLIIVRA